jgi:hypothetical protein
MNSWITIEAWIMAGGKLSVKAKNSNKPWLKSVHVRMVSTDVPNSYRSLGNRCLDGLGNTSQKVGQFSCLHSRAIASGSIKDLFRRVSRCDE